MAAFRVVVIGASAGGLPALSAIMGNLPPDLDAAVLIVMHVRASANGVLPQILGRTTGMPVAFARDRQRLQPGRAYVARPDFHLLVDGERLRVVHGPAENGFRPAIDPLFRSAARAHGSRVIGVVLSGALSDGAFGLSVIKQHGGVAIVQDPEDAVIDSMPRSALEAVPADHVLPAAQIAAAIEQLGQVDEDGEGPMARSGDLEPQLATGETLVAEMEERYGPPTPLTCPDCGGALWQANDSSVARYQCHVGHQYAENSLDVEQREAIDTALWTAVRVLEEHASLKMRMADRASRSGLVAVTEAFAVAAREAHRQAEQIRGVLLAGGGESSASAAPTKRGSKAASARKATKAKRPRRRTSKRKR
jgi:two-component system, chemotaxis family, protein-glutamate methylesterase/glutaminase